MKGRRDERRGSTEMWQLSGGFSLLLFRIPCRRNQDVALIRDFAAGSHLVGLVDGWNHPERIVSDTPGREAAAFVAHHYPDVFLDRDGRDLADAAQEAAEQVDREFLRRYPADVASVGVFAFSCPGRTRVVSVGTVHLWSRNGTEWRKPREISDCFLPQPPHQSGSRTFWGRGELKGDPFYTLRTETAILSGDAPLLLATDGIDDVMNLSEINGMQSEAGLSPARFFAALVERIVRSEKQRDDITLLLRWKR